MDILNIKNYEMLETDRIIKINNFKIFVNDNYVHHRRNIECYSYKLDKYIKYNNLSKDNKEHIILIGNIIKDKQFDDIELIKIIGYY